MKYSTYLFFLIIIIITSCHSTQNLDKTSENVILFGNGGGFSGQVVEYVLDEKGTFMKNDKLKKEVTVIPSLKKSETKKLFKEMQTLRLDTIHFQHPGNTYYFIRSNSSETSFEVVWGDPNNLPPPEIIQFYDLLISITK